MQTYGAERVYACVTHPILSADAAQSIRDSVIEKLVVTDTVPIAPEKRNLLGDRLEVLHIGPLLGEIIRRIHESISVGDMFPE